MKMNLKINVTFGGTIKVEENITKINATDVEKTLQETTNKDKTIDMSGLVMNMEISEEVEDITVKEYLQAVGECINTSLQGLFNKK